MPMLSPSLSRADLDTTLARVTSKPNVIGALVLARETGAIIRSTLADDEQAKKYSLGVKSSLPFPRQHEWLISIGLLQCGKEMTRDIDEDVWLPHFFFIRRVNGVG